jgi:hypothetical protein
MKTLRKVVIGIALIAVTGIIGCQSNSGSDSTVPVTPGGGTGGGTTGPTLSSAVAIGTMAKGSVKVNGVEFTVSANTTSITADDNPKPETYLDDGMQVKVKGTLNDDKITGKAEKVEVVNEVRGAIAAKGTDTITVNGQTVLIDGGTVLANTTGIAALGASDNIEVHGVRDAAGVIHATRIEKLAAGPLENEVRGAVSAKTATSFTIGGLPIAFNSSVIVPAGATFADGDVVEVHLDGATAIRIVVEHLEHPEFEHAEGQEISFEGILSGFSASGTFKVGAQPVTLTTGTNLRIDGGVLADLIDGMKVEAEGHTVTAGVLLAEKITIKDSIRIEANATTAGKADVLNKTVNTTSMVKLSSNLTSTAAITAGEGLRIRGFVNRDGSTITATRIDAQSNPVQSDKTIIQGPVTGINATTHTFSILGITVTTGSAVARPNDDHSNDNNALQTTPDAFFAALTEGRSIVKAKGTISGGSLAATEIELE